MKRKMVWRYVATGLAAMGVFMAFRARHRLNEGVTPASQFRK